MQRLFGAEIYMSAHITRCQESFAVAVLFSILKISEDIKECCGHVCIMNGNWQPVLYLLASVIRVISRLPENEWLTVAGFPISNSVAIVLHRERETDFIEVLTSINDCVIAPTKKSDLRQAWRKNLRHQSRRRRRPDDVRQKRQRKCNTLGLKAKAIKDNIWVITTANSSSRCQKAKRWGLTDDRERQTNEDCAAQASANSSNKNPDSCRRLARQELDDNKTLSCWTVSRRQLQQTRGL